MLPQLPLTLSSLQLLKHFLKKLSKDTEIAKESQLKRRTERKAGISIFLAKDLAQKPGL